MLEGIYLLGAAALSVVVGTWLIGELSPKRFRGRNIHNDELMHLAEMKHDLQRASVRWLAVLAASVVGAYKLNDVINLIIRSFS